MAGRVTASFFRKRVSAGNRRPVRSAAQDFTSARNELARRLKKEGDSGAADEIRALKKPSVSAWAINQLSRLEPDAVGDLLVAADAVRKEQKRLLREARKPDSLRDALAKERTAINALTERARSILEQADRPTTEGMIQRIAGTLQAAAVENDGRALLKADRLTGDIEPTGFEAFTGVELPRTRSVYTRRAVGPPPPEGRA